MCVCVSVYTFKNTNIKSLIIYSKIVDIGSESSSGVIEMLVFKNSEQDKCTGFVRKSMGNTDKLVSYSRTLNT